MSQTGLNRFESSHTESNTRAWNTIDPSLDRLAEGFAVRVDLSALSEKYFPDGTARHFYK